MIVAETRAHLREVLGAGESPAAPASQRGGLTLVPTMGALHQGHARLLELAASRPGRLVASIFVNPMQFGPGEDLARYPRTLEADLDLCRSRGVDVVFAPSVAEMYPVGDPLVTIDPGRLGAVLEGAVRPDHFRGVLTVVAKLFHLVAPDVAVFGQKDYQQLVLVSRMVDDLCMPIEVTGAETVRDPDGLALSSRNRYLTDSERPAALSLNRALLAGRAAAAGGPLEVLGAAEKVLASESAVAVDYLSLRGADLADPPARGRARLLVAARVGATRLVDNIEVALGDTTATGGAPQR